MVRYKLVRNGDRRDRTVRQEQYGTGQNVVRNSNRWDKTVKHGAAKHGTVRYWIE